MTAASWLDWRRLGVQGATCQAVAPPCHWAECHWAESRPTPAGSGRSPATALACTGLPRASRRGCPQMRFSPRPSTRMAWPRQPLGAHHAPPRACGRPPARSGRAGVGPSIPAPMPDPGPFLASGIPGAALPAVPDIAVDGTPRPLTGRICRGACDRGSAGDAEAGLVRLASGLWGHRGVSIGVRATRRVDMASFLHPDRPRACRATTRATRTGCNPIARPAGGGSRG